MFYLLLLLAGLTWIAYCRYEKRKIIELSKRLPGDLPWWPLVGHAHLFWGNDEEQMKIFQKSGRLVINRGGVASYWIGSRLYIMVADPVAGETVLKNCLEKDDVTRFLRSLLGNGSIYAAVPIWRPRRKLLAPAFNMKNLNQFVDVFAKQSTVMVDQLKPCVGTGTFSVWKYLTTYTFDAVCETSLGVQMDSQRHPDQPFLDALDEITRLLAARMLQPWLYADWVYKTLPQCKRVEKCRKLMYDFVKQIIKEKRHEITQQRQRKPLLQSEADPRFKSFVETLLDSSFTELETLEEIMVVCVAGTDTSAVAASFTTVLLSRYPEIQDKLFEEIQDVFGDSDRPVSAEDLPKLKFLEAVIKESLRMYPPVPIIVRSVDKDTELPSGVTLVKGVGIIINIWAIHRNPYYWGSDADVFRPERFLEPLKHPTQFLPFSYGLRNCLGYQYAMMSVKTVLATLLRQYRVLPPVGADQSKLKEPLRLKFDVMMKDVDKFQIQLENRSII